MGQSPWGAPQERRGQGAEEPNRDAVFLVLYNAAGSNLTSALLELRRTDRGFLVNPKTRWAPV